VRQDATPRRVEGVLTAVAQLDHSALSSVSYDMVYDLTQKLGYDLNRRYEPIVLLKDLGMLDRRSSLLTPLGKDLWRLVKAKPSAFHELMHCLHYSTWDSSSPFTNCFSWSYRAVCDSLWESGSGTVDRRQLVSLVLEQGATQLGAQHISFGPSSIDGILHWLRVLNPPVITSSQVLGKVETVFSRRAFCPPETLALAIDHLYRSWGVDYQVNLLLDSDKREMICRFCLLDPTAFETALDWAVGQFLFLHRGGAGGWGSYVLLTRQPKIADFVG